MQTRTDSRRLEVRAAMAGVTANVILGASSLYWKALGAIPATTLLGYRILVSLATIALVLAARRRLLAALTRLSLRLFLVHAAAACLVVVNWGTFIWASIHGHVVESGLGYLLAPFVAIAVGATVLGDKMSWIRASGLALILSVVAYLLWSSGELAHWVYLTIGLTWGGYACLKKWTSLDPFSGLFVETAVLAALLPVFMWSTWITLSIPHSTALGQLALLAMCGVVSVVPLALFSFAASGLPLSVMGFFQFVLPSTQLIVALLVYRQPVSNSTLACFVVMWLSLAMIVAEPLVMSWQRRRGPKGGQINETV